MNRRDLILLHPYRLPGRTTQTLSDEEASAFLNGYLVLWHPAVLARATGLPDLAFPRDHEEPEANRLFAVPDQPAVTLPEDWRQRLTAAGSAAFTVTADRGTTLANLKAALPAEEWNDFEGDEPAGAKHDADDDEEDHDEEEDHEEENDPDTDASDEVADEADDHAAPSPPAEPVDLWTLDPELVKPFYGLGLGYLVVESLFDTMEHEHLLEKEELLEKLRDAIRALRQGDADRCRDELSAAAELLVAARDNLYPVSIHIIDLFLLDERPLDAPLPLAFQKELSINFLAPVPFLEKLAREKPDRLAEYRDRLAADQLDICSGPLLEREDTLLPIESQLWNLLRGLQRYQELLETDLRIWARKRFALHPQFPIWLNSAGIRHALLLPLDGSTVPNFQAASVGWASTSDKQVDCYTRAPHPVESPQTFFHMAHYLHKTIEQDQAATMCLLHRASAPSLFYEDWIELTRLGPVLGQWSTITHFLEEAVSDYTPAPPADELVSDYLENPLGWHPTDPATGPLTRFVQHVKLRRRLDTAWALAAIHRGLAGKSDTLQLDGRLRDLENQLELGGAPEQELQAIQEEATQALATRLQARAADNQPGFLVLNPCSFARRVALELEGIPGPLPIQGPLKAGQFAEGRAQVVVEVPPLGFAWFPRTAPKGTPHPSVRMKLADKTGVRNEFFEAEIDPDTGGLRAFRDNRLRIHRVNQQIVYHPASKMRCQEVKVTASGSALGEVVTSGVLLGEGDQVLARFRQRFRAWLTRPVLDIRIEIEPEFAPTGYPWHHYYAARFSWEDERGRLLRGVVGSSYPAKTLHPESPEYLELRQGKQSTAIFPAGLPFHQRHAQSVDVLLITEKEPARTFDLALGIEREYPMQTALGIVTPVPMVATSKGPPHVGPSGWLFHLDAPNVMLTSLRPAPDGADALIARLQECISYGSHLQFRSVRNPKRAELLDIRGVSQHEVDVQDDAVSFELSPADFVQLRIEYS